MKKIRMDDLIQEIYADETLPLEEGSERDFLGDRVSSPKKIQKEDTLEDENQSDQERRTPVEKAGKRLDEEMQKRIEEKIMCQIHGEEKYPVAPGRRRKKKWFVLLLAATLVIAFGLTAAAADQNDWDVALMNFMGIDSSNMTQLEDGTLEIGIFDTCMGTDYSRSRMISQKEGDVLGSSEKTDEGQLDPDALEEEDTNAAMEGISKPVTVTATSSIGDKNAVYIRFDTDYEVPEDFDPDQDYILPENLNWYLKNYKMNGTFTPIPHGGTYTSVVEDGKLVLLLEISGCKGVNTAGFEMEMENLILYHDLGAEQGKEAEPEELIYEGNWSMGWRFSYRSHVKRKYCMKKINVSSDNVAAGTEQDGDVKNTSVFLTKIEVSPLGVRLEGVKNPLKKNGIYTWDAIIYDSGLEKITWKDGRVLEVDSASSGGTKNNMWINSYYGLEVLGETLDVKEIYSITVGGEEIVLSF